MTPLGGIEPTRSGTVERAGVTLWWDEYGEGPSTVHLMPPWNLTRSTVWRTLVGCLMSRYRVVVSDPIGNGRGGGSADPARFSPAALADDAVAVLDATGTERAVVVAHSRTSQALLRLAGERPDRVAAAAFLAPLLPYTPSFFPRSITHPALAPAFESPLTLPLGWGRFNAHYLRRHPDRFGAWFGRLAASATHMERVIDETEEAAADTDIDSLLASLRSPIVRDRAELDRLAARVEVPVLVVHGDADRLAPVADGRWLAGATGGRLVVLPDGDHCPHGRPVARTALEIRALVEEVFPRRTPASTSRRSRNGRKRVLAVSSPIGLGHSRRDLAVLRSLRELRDDVDVEWLAQDPVTRVLDEAGESVHPASRHLLSECRHFELESAGHELDVFRAFNRADALMAHNFMVFRDVLADTDYDLVVGDEAWEVDHFLHEHPEEKRAPYVWLTDFVGVLPLPESDQRESRLIADGNALMLEQQERRQVRDLSLFVGNPDDVVDVPFGPGLPRIGDWVRGRFTFTGFAGARRYDETDRARARARLGVPGDGPLCVVAVGGSGVGGTLLDRAAAAHELARVQVDGLTTVVVTGPRIDPSGPETPGLLRLGYVPDLDVLLAAADYAVVQGGLATAMELAANHTPFTYVPLRKHFEQQIHVHHRLGRYGAGTRVDDADAEPDHLAALVVAGIGRRAGNREVESDGHVVAARHLAEVLA